MDNTYVHRLENARDKCKKDKITMGDTWERERNEVNLGGGWWQRARTAGVLLEGNVEFKHEWLRNSESRHFERTRASITSSGAMPTRPNVTATIVPPPPPPPSPPAYQRNSYLILIYYLPRQRSHNSRHWCRRIRMASCHIPIIVSITQIAACTKPPAIYT